MILNDYNCVPPCKACRESGQCSKAFDAPISDHVQVRNAEWAPNMLPFITLPCGCKDIPWPLVHVFGENVYRIECDIHGTQKISKQWREERKRERTRRIQSAEEAKLDIPPF